MTDIASELAQYIEDNLGYTQGTDLFIGTMPEDSESGIYIMRVGGVLNDYLPMQTTYISIYYKDTQAVTAMTNLETVKNYLHRMHNTETANSYIFSMLAISDIEDMGLDLESNKVFKFTLEVMHRPTSLIS